MVKVKYMGQNFVVIERYKIVNGYNEIKDEDFWNMMKIPTFAHRVNNKIFRVPDDFPLEKPQESKPAEVLIEKQDVEMIDLSEMSMKDAIKFVKACNDVEQLKYLLDKETRSKVLDILNERILSLES